MNAHAGLFLFTLFEALFSLRLCEPFSVSRLFEVVFNLRLCEAGTKKQLPDTRVSK